MSRTKAAADLVLRYLTARALFRQTPWEMPSNLEYLIERGVRLLPGGVVINEVPLAPAPAIIDDRKDSSFWSAILGGRRAQSTWLQQSRNRFDNSSSTTIGHRPLCVRKCKRFAIR